MKPIKQTTFGKQGNCFPACIASVLEIPLEGIPNFCVEFPSKWHWEVNKWLSENHGVVLLTITPWDQDHVFPPFVVDTYHLMSGPSVRGHHHSIVALNGKMVHDPHPDGHGLIEVKDWDFFVVADPGRTV